MGTWKVIIPELRDNYVKNPIAMGALAGTISASGVGASVALSVIYAYLGYRSCILTGGGGASSSAIYTTQALPNLDHYITCRVHTSSTFTGNLTVTTDSGAHYITMVLLGQEGDWKVYGCGMIAMYCTTSVATAIVQSSFSTTVIIGHLQVEVGSYPTTPITGDMKGFASDGYKWLGTPHASMSRRYWFERSGGSVVDIEDTYNLRVLYGLGTGMPPIQHNVQDLALLPGALYAGHKVLPRILDLVSGTKTTTNAGVSLARSKFINAIKPDLVSPEQPFVFRYTGVNANKPVDFYAVYDSGMEFQTSSGKIDKPVARFICYDPFAYETHTEGKELVRQIEVENANYAVKRVDGVWSCVSLAFNSTVWAMTEGKDGCIYLGGFFTNVGDANGDYIVKWNPITGTLSSLGTGLAGGSCLCLLTAPNGDIYAGGYFTSAGGVANTAYIAKWNGSAWVSLSTTSLGATVRALAWGLDGTLYVGGDFTNAGGVANADYICRYTGTSWAAVGDVLGANGAVYDIKISASGYLYAIGDFTQMNSITVNRIACYRGSPTSGTWAVLGSGLNALGYSLAIDQNGSVYVGGQFTTANGVSCNRIAVWNGITFFPLGSGADAIVTTLKFDQYGLLWASGLFTSMGGITIADKIAKWNGTTWFPVPINLPGAATAYSLCFISDGSIYIGYDTAGTAYASAVTNVIVSNSGSHATYPKIGIIRADDGTSLTIKYIRNETTRQNLYLNYELQKGESLTIDLAQGNKSVVSSYYGAILRAILRGSDFSKFSLLGGTNVISVYTSETGSPTVMCWIEYKITHWSADCVAV